MGDLSRLRGVVGFRFGLCIRLFELRLAVSRYTAGLVRNDLPYLLGISEDQSFHANIPEERIESLLGGSKLRGGKGTCAQRQQRRQLKA
jgi:hypothetical protein